INVSSDNEITEIYGDMYLISDVSQLEPKEGQYQFVVAAPIKNKGDAVRFLFADDGDGLGYGWIEGKEEQYYQKKYGKRIGEGYRFIYYKLKEMNNAKPKIIGAYRSYTYDFRDMLWDIVLVKEA
ncbi:MAG: hypothetical protein ACRCWQ_05680, partial [Bacilli bacterium]